MITSNPHYIILPLSSEVQSIIKLFVNNLDYPTLDLDVLMGFLITAINSDNNLFDSIVEFTEDWLLQKPDSDKHLIIQTIKILEKLFLSIQLNLTQYGVEYDKRLQYEFNSFLSETTITLRQTKNSNIRV